LSEDVLVRVKRLESPESARSRRRITAFSEKTEPRAQQQQQQQAPKPPRREAPAAAEEKPSTQWVWLLDEDKLENRGARPETKPAAPREDEEDEDETLTTPAPGGGRRRRRRRGGARQHTELPGHRGKHLAGGDDRGE
jgi:hypothetical protein